MVIGIPDSPNEAYAFGLRQMADNYQLKADVDQLNRELASWKAKVAQLEQQIKELKKAGALDEIDIGNFLTEVLTGKDPRERVTQQRKEINNLHRVIKGLKDEIARLREQ